MELLGVAMIYRILYLMSLLHTAIYLSLQQHASYRAPLYTHNTTEHLSNRHKGRTEETNMEHLFFEDKQKLGNKILRSVGSTPTDSTVTN